MRKKSKITWKPGVQRRDPVPRPHYPQEKYLPETEEMLHTGALYVGALCVLKDSLAVDVADPKFIEPPYPTTSRVWHKKDRELPIGSVAVYAGTVRDEMTGQAGTIHVLQHTFIVNGGRYIIHPNHVRPAG